MRGVGGALRGAVMASVLVTVLIGGRAHAGTVEGTVVRVVDGDTVWVRADAAGNGTGRGSGRSAKPIKLRLQGIDAPERCQRWGAQSTAALTERVLHQRVQVRTRARDDYQRTLGNLLLNGEDVSEWMVLQGHAWSYHYRHSHGPYADQEQAARGSRHGLFADADAVEPRWFRRDHGPCD